MSAIEHKKTEFSDKRVQIALNVSPSVTVTTPPATPPHTGRSTMQNLRDGSIILALFATGYDIYQGKDSKLKAVFGQPDIKVSVSPVVVERTDKSSITFKEAIDMLNRRDSLNNINNTIPTQAVDTSAVMENDTAATAVKLDTLSF